VQLEPGQFSTDPKHLHPHKISAVERGAGDLLHRTQLIGPHTHRWAKAMLDERGIEGVRVLVGLHALAKQHVSAELEDACEIAQSHGAYRLRAIRTLIKRRGPKQDQFEFMDCHPIIRTMGEYTEAARRAIHGPDRPCVSPAMTAAARTEHMAPATGTAPPAAPPRRAQASPRKGSRTSSLNTQRSSS
jgi:hypothetical protein